MLHVVAALSKRIIRPTLNYNDGVELHRLDPIKHPLFQDYIGAIDATHVRAVLPRYERVNFIGRKGVPTQNVLAVCAGYIGNTYNAQILTLAILSLKINFLQPTLRKYYLVDSDFSHRSGYMVPYKGSDILYHFQ